MFTRNVVTIGAIGSLEFRSGGLGVGDKVADQAAEIQAVSAMVCRLETTSGTMKPALCSCRRFAETLGCIDIEGALLHWDRLFGASAHRKKLPGKKSYTFVKGDFKHGDADHVFGRSGHYFKVFG